MREHERIDDLNFNGYKIIQNPNKFCFGMDSVLLCDFARIKKDDYVIDFGCGNGIICILLAAKKKLKKIIGIEIQEDVAELAQRNVLLNGLESKIEIINGDIKNIFGLLSEKKDPKQKFDVVITNPPYIKNGLLNKNNSKAIARHEIFCTLEDIISNAYKILKDGGRFIMVHRAERLADIFYLMRKYKIEPKLMRIVYPYLNQPSEILLIEGIKNSNSSLKILSPLIIHKHDKNN